MNSYNRGAVKRSHQPPPDSFRLPGELGKRLKRLRQAQGLSQARVAGRMGRTGEGGASIELQMRWSKWLRGLVDVGFATRAGDGERDARVAETASSAPDPSRCPELAAIFFTVFDKFRPKP
jgi:transcriptional regulator with XRE-family HTH domain